MDEDVHASPQNGPLSATSKVITSLIGVGYDTILLMVFDLRSIRYTLYTNLTGHFSSKGSIH